MHSRWIVLLLTLAFLAALVPSPSTALVSYGAFGTHPEAGDDDFGILLEALPATQIPYLAYEDEEGNADEEDFVYYIHFDDTSPTTTDTNEDFRIAKPASGTAGSDGTIGALVGSTATVYDAIWDLDGSTVLDAADRIDDFLCHLEVDGKPGFSDKDWLYVDVDDDGDLSAGDLRLSTPSASLTPSVSVPTLRYVQTGDADLSAATSSSEDTMPDTDDCESTTFDILFFDSDMGGDFDAGDTLVAVPSDGPVDDFLSLGQVFLSTSGSRTHGNHASGSEPGAVASLDDLAASDAALVSTEDSADCDDDTVRLCDLYIHFGDGTHIEFGDIIIRKGATDSSGAAKSFMTRVTSESNGAGQAIIETTPFIDQVYFIDNPDGDDGYGIEDWTYIDVPDVLAGEDAVGTLDLSANDIRLTKFEGGASYNAGTTVKASDEDMDDFDAEPVNVGSHTTPWNLLLQDKDQSTGLALQTLANAKFRDDGADDLWDAADEPVYISADGIVSDGDIRIFAGDTTEAGSTSGSLTEVDCGTDADCTVTLVEANTDIKVTGPDTTLDEDQGEFVVWSSDAWATTGHDRAVMWDGLAAGDLLTAAEAESYAYSASGDAFYLQWDEATDPDGALNIWKVNDLKLASSADWVGPTDSGFVPTLHVLADASQSFTWYDRGEDNPDENGFYLELGGTQDDLAVRDVRLAATTFSTGGAAGKQLASTNTAETSAASTSLEQDAVEIYDRVFYFDEGTGPSGLDPTDPLYIDLPVAFDGGTADDISRYDIRLVDVDVDGGESYDAGSFVSLGDDDLGFNVPVLFDGTPGYLVYYFDENRDGAFNGDDFPYLHLVDDTSAAPATVHPDLLSIRMASSGSTTSGGGGGGDDDDDDDDTDSDTDSSTSSSSTSSSSSSTSVSSSSTSVGPGTPADPATLNMQLQASLTVERDGDDNILTWDDVSGESGYQVWSHNSPYVLLANLPAGTTTYTDVDAPADTVYLVTAAVGGQALTEEQVNNGDVPGYTDVPEGEKREGGGGKGWIPGPNPILVLALLAGLAILARRRVK